MGHDHSHGAEELPSRALLWAVIVNLGLSLFEFAAGILAGSVALLADALHNTNDAAALLIAWIARRIARRGADEQFTFGYRRAELIGAMIQLTALIVVGLYLVYEAIHRLVTPAEPLGLWIMAAAGVAVVVDVITAWLLWAMSRGSLNVRAAFLHNLTDAAASIAVLIGGAAIYFLGWAWIDPLLTLGIAGYILWMSVGLLRQTARILMEGVPVGLDLGAVQRDLETVDGVHGLHHLHVWALGEHQRALEAHVVVDDETGFHQGQELRRQLKALLRERHDITHSTIELESLSRRCDDDDLHCSPGTQPQ